MNRITRFVLFTLGVVVVLAVVAAVSLPLFLNADSFRTRIESTLSKSLGRTVTIGKLNLSVWTGGLVAENATVADDPRFSSQPFIQAESVKIRVAMLPLILHRDVQVKGFVLDSPRVQLLRAANGTWNYSTIGGSAGKQDEETKKTFPDLTVGEVQVNNGRITVGTQPGAATTVVSTPNRVYEQVDLNVKNFGFTGSFPFTASAHLPSDGTVSVSGTAGPINQQDASETPFNGHLEIKHLDPLAAGFVDASGGISGLVESVVLDAAWSGQQMHVTKLVVDSPHLTVMRSNTPKQPKPAGANAEGSTMLENLSVDSAEVRNGAVTLTTEGQAGAPAVYQGMNATITNLTPKSWSPFTVSAQLPGGGTLNANGKAGPFFNTKDSYASANDNYAATPVDAQVTLKHVELGTSGVLPPDAGIGGTMDLQAQVRSDGQTLNAAGTARVVGIKLARDGQPSAKPVEAQFALTQNERAMTGDLQHATVSVGRATFDLAGTYQTSGPTTAIDLKVNGQAVPIDEIEAFLPALGVKLPQGSRLEGGTVTTALTVSGSTGNPVISGPARLDNTQLAGFDLGAKLAMLSKFTGGKIGTATGSGTHIRSLSMNVREAGGGIRTDNIALEVAGVGSATGAGSVSPGGALDYNMLLKLTELTGVPSGGTAAANSGGGGLAEIVGGLAGLIPGGGGAGGALEQVGGLLKAGIPVAIGGTTTNPTFAPNVRGLATGAGVSVAEGLLSKKRGKADPAGKVVGDPLKNALGGLFGKH